MKIDLAFPELPPAHDGIGDYTARLSQVLAGRASVRVLTARADAEPIAGAEVVESFAIVPPHDVNALADAVIDSPPDWLIVQYNPFSWGHWGFNPWLPHVLRNIKQACPSLRVAVMVHETFVHCETWQFTVMTLWQRPQLWALGRVADLMFFSIEAWARRFASWFPHTPIAHLPVGCNIPVETADRNTVRKSFGVSDRFVLGLFGSASRDALDHVRAAVSAVGETKPATLLYVGTHGKGVRDALKEFDVLDLGVLPAQEVSLALSMVDVFLAPYRDGASTRRGTLMAGLAHGLPVVTTFTGRTDYVLKTAAPRALRLATAGQVDEFGRTSAELASDLARVQVGEAGKVLYHAEFDWPVIARRLLEHLTTTRTSYR